MDSFISTFHIDWKILAAQAVNFGIVFLLIYFFALKPLKKILGERTKSIEGGLSDAKTNAEILANTKKEYDLVLSKARIEANVIFQEGKNEAEIKKAEIIEKTKKEVDIMVLNGKKILESEKVKIIDEAKQEIVSLVVKATEKLLESNIDEKSESKAFNNIKKL